MSEKYQREIEEILGNIEELRSRGRAQRKRGLLWATGAAVGRLVGGRGRRLSPGRIMLVGLALLLVALLLKGSLPGLMAPILLWAAVGLLFLGYALFFINPPSYEKRWRGQVIEPPPRWRDLFLRRRKGS